MQPFESPLDLEYFKQFDWYTEFELQLAQFIYGISKVKQPELFFAALELANSVSSGNTCIDLDNPSERLRAVCEHAPIALAPIQTWPHIFQPIPGEITSEGLKPAASLPIGKCGEFTPLILDKNLLYLHKYWHYENIVSQTLLSRSQKITLLSAEERNRALTLLDTLFPQEVAATNFQRVAACIALTHSLCVITGGPGTGKTSAIARIIILLRYLHPDRIMRIACAAPTGKAANRLDEAVRTLLDASAAAQPTDKPFLLSVETIHRLLGASATGSSFQYTKENKLLYDCVIIDESSMVDVYLMAKLCEALPENCTLILVGDHNQLASVEAGSVLQELCSTVDSLCFTPAFDEAIRPLVFIHDNDKKKVASKSPFANCIVSLQKTFRFQGAIAQSTAAIRNGDVESLLSLISSNPRDIILTQTLDAATINACLESEVLRQWTAYCTATTMEERFAAFSRFRVLCVTRYGPAGVEQITKKIEAILYRAGLLQPQNLWYDKRPVMITQNNHPLNLYNGDIGIIGPDPRDATRLTAWFQSFARQSAANRTALRSVPLSQLPPHSSAFALTIHKSQGSEYDSVLCILPRSEQSLLRRELVYTAFSRCKTRIHLLTEVSTLRQAIAQRTERTSGLGKKLSDRTRRS
ncbi:MAG: exodeoxyribonuclease V subunit alpha [Chitinivibrionales bacterium]|nr:exodeoxyribonuclease V subunit alpha [Chitinivibrionales bacterium]